MGLTRVFTFHPCLPCATVFCVHSVLEHQQQQLDLLAAEQLQTRASGTVHEGRWHGPSISSKTHLAGSLSFSQPGEPPCWVISLAFGLIGLQSYLLLSTPFFVLKHLSSIDELSIADHSSALLYPYCSKWRTLTITRALKYEVWPELVHLTFMANIEYVL
jgi:hypothetical protein